MLIKQENTELVQQQKQHKTCLAVKTTKSQEREDNKLDTDGKLAIKRQGQLASSDMPNNEAKTKWPVTYTSYTV